MADLIMDENIIQENATKISGIGTNVNSTYTTFKSGYLFIAPEPIGNKLGKLVDTPFAKYKDGFKKITDWLDTYVSELNALESSLAAFKGSNVTTPITFTGKFEDLFSKVTMPVLQTGGDTLANYKTFGGGSSTTTEETTKVDLSGLDMSNYPTGKSQEAGKQRAVLVAKYLMANGGFTAQQAAAMVGVYLDENNCNPGEVMEAEKSGKGAKGTGGSGYGAGIGSWTFADFKKQCLRDAGFPENTKIESLTLKQQCDMIIATSQKSYKKYYDALKRCNNIEDASATAVCITGGVGFSKNWSTHPTTAEAKKLSDHYGSSNDKRFGKSSYHWNLDKRRLNYAKEIYGLLTT